MSLLAPTAVLTPSRDVIARDIAGEHLLVPVRSGAADMDCLFTADGAGAFVWTCLDGRRDLAAVARLVADEFDVDPDTALGDVARFAADLVDAGLATASGEGR
jgi:coenzyme PQQ synthesis protein D (PqqD)